MWLIRRNRLKWLAVILAFPCLGPFLISRRTRQLPLRFGAWVATVGTDHDTLRALARQHIEQVRARGEVFVGADARARIHAHASQGHEVVVATGSLELLVEEILQSEDLVSVRVIGSVVRKRLGGMVVKEHCYGARKVAMLEERGFCAPWDFVYSDHEADLPLLERGRERYLVNPKPKSQARLRDALGASAEVLVWK